MKMTLKDPAKLKEKDTRYSFLDLWRPSCTEECFENDGGSSPRVRYPNNLRGLYVECSHWLCRGNSFGEVKLKDLVKYIQRENRTLKKTDISKVPDMLVKDWLRELYNGNKKLRKQIGLDKIDILKNTFASLGLKETLEAKKTNLEKTVSDVIKNPNIKRIR